MIPFVDLKTQYQTIKTEIDEAIGKVLDTGAYILGPAVADFERKFAIYCACDFAVAVNSGTSALHLALLAAGVGPGDEVILPAMTFLATASAVDYTGAKPVFVDVHPNTFTIDPEQIEPAITARTKAIVPVHLYGLCADMDAILETAKRNGLFVIEDAAQAHGAEYKGSRAGSMGDMGCFSFYPGKNLGAYGEGGAVTTNNPAFADTILMLRDWGSKEKYRHELKGYNYRMDGVQGAVLGVKVNHIEQWTEMRRSVAASYREHLDHLQGLRLQREIDGYRHVHHIFPVLTERRDQTLKHLQSNGVGAGIHYPTPVHLQKCFSCLNHKKGDFPVSESLANLEISLPMYPELKQEHIEKVVALLKDIHG